MSLSLDEFGQRRGYYAKYMEHRVAFRRRRPCAAECCEHFGDELCDCGAFEPRAAEAAQFLRDYYVFANAALAKFGPHTGTVETVTVRTIDSRPCDPIEPDPKAVCVTEDDLT